MFLEQNISQRLSLSELSRLSNAHKLWRSIKKHLDLSQHIWARIHNNFAASNSCHDNDSSWDSVDNHSTATSSNEGNNPNFLVNAKSSYCGLYHHCYPTNCSVDFDVTAWYDFLDHQPVRYYSRYYYTIARQLRLLETSRWLTFSCQLLLSPENCHRPSHYLDRWSRARWLFHLWRKSLRLNSQLAQQIWPSSQKPC